MIGLVAAMEVVVNALGRKAGADPEFHRVVNAMLPGATSGFDGMLAAEVRSHVHRMTGQ